MNQPLAFAFINMQEQSKPPMTRSAPIQPFRCSDSPNLPVDEDLSDLSLYIITCSSESMPAEGRSVYNREVGFVMDQSIPSTALPHLRRTASLDRVSRLTGSPYGAPAKAATGCSEGQSAWRTSAVQPRRPSVI